MPLVLWNILRKYSLVRSPQEEKVHRFAHSQTIKVKDDVFSVGVQRALKAALLLDPRLEDINIQFAKGGGTDIDLLFKEEEKVLLVHEKWANFETIHQTFSCETFRLSQRQSGKDFPFLCDHIAEDLIELTLNDIQGPLQLPPTRCMELRRKARERIQQTPRLIKVSRTNHPNELEVSWIGNESGLISQTYGSSIQYHVMLHRMSTCRSKKNNLLHKIGMFSKGLLISLFIKYY
jgi:hypothetical protein